MIQIPKNSIPVGSLHQQICNTSLRQFEDTNGDRCLYGLDFMKDEQILNWIHRTNGNYRKLQFPKTIEGMMSIDTMKNKFQLFEIIGYCTHTFWEEEETRAQFLEFLGSWSKNPAAYFKKTFAAQDESKSLRKADEEEEIEVGFVDGLFEMYKLRCDVAKARAE